MWIFTALGFFSIVRTRESVREGTVVRDMLMVRSRSHDDISQFAEVLARMGVDAPVKVTPQADYPFRLFAHEQHVAAAVAGMLLACDYSNFKDSVLKRQGSIRANAYHVVWEVLAKHFTPERPAQPQLDRTARHQGPKRVSGEDDGDGNCRVCGLLLENDEGTVHECPPGFHDGDCPRSALLPPKAKCTCMRHRGPVRVAPEPPAPRDAGPGRPRQSKRRRDK